MSKNDSFFSTAEDPELNKKILTRAQIELDLNRTRTIRKRWLSLMAPLTAALASFFVFKMVQKKESELLSNGPEQIELMTTLMENDESFDILEQLEWLEDLEAIEEIEV